MTWVSGEVRLMAPGQAQCVGFNVGHLWCRHGIQWFLAHLGTVHSPAEGGRNGKPMVTPSQVEGYESPLVGDPRGVGGVLLSRLLQFKFLLLNFSLKHTVVVSSSVSVLMDRWSFMGASLEQNQDGVGSS